MTIKNHLVDNDELPIAFRSVPPDHSFSLSNHESSCSHSLQKMKRTLPNFRETLSPLVVDRKLIGIEQDQSNPDNLTVNFFFFLRTAFKLLALHKND